MMTALTGDRGIGKTYFLTKKLYDKYKNNWFIITNYTFMYSTIDCSKSTPDEFYLLLAELGSFKEQGYEMVDLFPTFKHTGVVIGIDEAHLYFSADQYKRYSQDVFQNIIKLLAQARKGDIEILYVAQQYDKIDVNFRRYTEQVLHYRPYFKLRRWKPVQHPTRPCIRYEMRYLVPVIREEVHVVDHTKPTLSYTMKDDENFGLIPSPTATYKTSWPRLSGWLDPFPYNLYDSHQMLAMVRTEEQDFGRLKKISLVPHTYRKEKHKWFKKILGMPRNDEMPPTRYIVDPSLIDLPQLEKRSVAQFTIAQPEVLIKALRDFDGTPYENIVKPFVPRYIYKSKGTWKDWLRRNLPTIIWLYRFLLSSFQAGPKVKREPVSQDGGRIIRPSARKNMKRKLENE